MRMGFGISISIWKKNMNILSLIDLQMGKKWRQVSVLILVGCVRLVCVWVCIGFRCLRCVCFWWYISFGLDCWWELRLGIWGLWGRREILEKKFDLIVYECFLFFWFWHVFFHKQDSWRNDAVLEKINPRIDFLFCRIWIKFMYILWKYCFID